MGTHKAWDSRNPGALVSGPLSIKDASHMDCIQCRLPLGLHGQPGHPRVKEVESQVVDRVHAAGKKMTSDLIVAAGAAWLFLDGATEFLRASKSA